MTTFITSDCHLGHRNIIKLNPQYRQQFASIEEMNEHYINEWNNTVNDDDLIYILGDIVLCNPPIGIKLVSQLKGQKFLIVGNHDKPLLKYPEFRDLFIKIVDYYEVVHNNVKVVMSHYPIFDWNGAHRGSVMFHGHRHGYPVPFTGRLKDVGVDSTGKLLSNFDDLVNEMLQIPMISPRI